mgnify:CR=1 FL=1
MRKKFARTVKVTGTTEFRGKGMNRSCNVKHVTHLAMLRKKNHLNIIKKQKFANPSPIIDVKCDTDICW